jgi:hypothetical protein
MLNTQHRKPYRILSEELQTKITRIQAYIQYAIIGAFTVFSITTLVNLFASVSEDTESILIIIGAIIACIGGSILSNIYEHNSKDKSLDGKRRINS